MPFVEDCSARDHSGDGCQELGVSCPIDPSRKEGKNGDCNINDDTGSLFSDGR